MGPFPPFIQREREQQRQEVVEYDKGHGRIEQRTLTCSCWLGGYLDWPGVQQVFRLERIRRQGAKESVEVVYGLTSRPQKIGSAQYLLKKVRAHWAIENRLHYVRDETFGEDRCRVRQGGAEILSGLRNALNYLLESVGGLSKAACLRRFMIKPTEAIQLISNN